MNNKSEERKTIYRDQLVTSVDLEEFGARLLISLKNTMKEFSGEIGKKWLKSYEVKKLLGVSSGTLQNLRINGTLPFVKIGGVILYDQEDIQKMLSEHKHDPKFTDRRLGIVE